MAESSQTAAEERLAYPASTDEMIEELIRMGSLRSSAAADALRCVDRRHFWVPGGDSSAYIYSDTPVRHGRLHLSAPMIYAEALEALAPIATGMTFLNIGSGTGYFNTVISELTGDLATNHGIEHWPEVLKHAEARCRSSGKAGIQFFLGNVYQLDVDNSMRYDRIYIGACANSRSKYLYRLLEVGGIMVGPFQTGRSQELRRVVRRSETQFSVETLESVHFACLVEPAPSAAPGPPATDEDEATYVGVATAVALNGGVGLAGVPFTFSLRERPWSLERSEVYPRSFHRAVVVSAAGQTHDVRRPTLPREIWEQHVFPWCPRWWFESRRVALRTAAVMDSITTWRQSLPAPPPASMEVAPAPPSTPPTELPLVALPEEDAQVPLTVDDVIFEVYDNGQNHAIGLGVDPDDADFLFPSPTTAWHIFAAQQRPHELGSGPDGRDAAELAADPVAEAMLHVRVDVQATGEATDEVRSGPRRQRRRRHWTY